MGSLVKYHDGCACLYVLDETSVKYFLADRKNGSDKINYRFAQRSYLEMNATYKMAVDKVNDSVKVKPRHNTTRGQHSEQHMGG